MRLGIVDIGTLSLRFDVYQTEPPYAVSQLVHRYRSMPRIGKALAGEAPRATAPIVEEFQRVRAQADEQQIDKLLAVGTSALREAAGRELVDEIAQLTGIQIRVLSGEDEARLTSLGIFANEPSLSGKIGLVDVGGGSTELSFCEVGKSAQVLSVDIGASRLEQMFFQERDPDTDLISETSLKAAKDYIEQHLASLQSEADKFDFDLLVGSSGTVRTLERLKIDKSSSGKLISSSAISKFTLQLRNSSRKQILAIPGMERNRADVLLPGCLILEAIMKTLDAREIQVTHFSLRHGVLEEELQKLRADLLT